MDAFEIGGFDGRYANLLANVSGTAGISTLGYTRLQQAGGGWFSGAGNGYIYNLAFGNNAITNVIPADPITTATTYRYGNWDAYNGSTQCNASEVPSGIAVYPNPVPSTCPSSSSWPASFYFPARPSWYSTGIPFPAMGGDVTGGNVGACGGTLNTSGQFASVGATNASQCAGKGLGAAWGGHINAIPAMAYYLGLGGLPDGTGPILPFDGSTYYASTPTAVVPVFTPPGASSGSSAQPYGTVINLATASSGCGPYIFWGSTNPPTNNGTTFTILGAVTIYGQVQGCPGYLNSPVGSIAYTLTAPPAPTNVSVIQNQ
jgi:hypothetical protein